METFPYQDLPINYNQIYTNDGQGDGSGATDSGGLSSGQGTPRRSLSQTLLSQMSSPTAGFGLTGRSTSPSPFVSNALSRKSSFNRNFMSRGPSLQSLVKSFINRVSRGTQTDCDDNFDQVSIASVTSGFSAIANDLTHSRLKLFLNDNPTRYSKSYASSQVDDSEFVEELQKLRGEINGEFGGEPEPTYTENQFDIDDLSGDPESVREQKSYRKVDNAPPKVITCDREAETDAVDTNECSTQTDAPEEVQVSEKAIETEPIVEPEVEPKKEPEAVQTKPPDSDQPAQTRWFQWFIDSGTPSKPATADSETQTDLLKLCEHCVVVEQPSETNCESVPQSEVPQDSTVIQQPQPQIVKCEFLISHADIICKENKIITGESTTETAQKKLALEEVPAKDDPANGDVNQSEPTAAKKEEEIHELKVEVSMADKPTNGTNQANGNQNGVDSGSVPNGTLTKDGKKKKKDKEKKTPKKSPRKNLAIIPGKDDEEREKNHQAALGHVRPKCCTIS